MKDYLKPKWAFEPTTGSIVYFEGGYFDSNDLFDPEKAPKPSIVIPRRAYYDLLEYIKEHEKDVVKTDRTEDLKIIHRLIDVLLKVGISK